MISNPERSEGTLLPFQHFLARTGLMANECTARTQGTQKALIANLKRSEGYLSSLKIVDVKKNGVRHNS
jgi:hypothetical protein